MYLSEREKAILDILLGSQQLFFSVKTISKGLKVSVRTIQRELVNLEASLGKFDLQLERVLNRGIRVKGEQKDIDKLKFLLQDLGNYQPDQEERAIIIFYKLMTSSFPAKVNNLSRELAVSNTTLTSDLDYLEGMLAAFPIKLIRRPGYGLELTGRERDKRLVFINLLMNNLENSPLYSIEEDEFIFLKQNHPILNRLNSELILSLVGPLKDALKKLPFTLTDYAKLETLFYLALSTERIGINSYIKNISYEDDNMTGELKTSKEAYAYISQNILKEGTPKEEIGFFADHLKGAKRLEQFDINDKLDLNYLAIELTDFVSRQTAYQFQQDKRFMDGLISHLEPLFNRVKSGILVSNPLKEDIKRDYPAIFNALRGALKYKFPSLTFSEDEISFLTIHFASALPIQRRREEISTLVVCTNGIGASRMLSKRLLDNFPDLAIVEESSIKGLSRLDMDDFHLIISTVGIYGANFDYTLVNPMLTEEDKVNIERAINNLLVLDKKKDDRKDRTGEGNLISRIDIIETVNLTINQLLTDFDLVNIGADSLEEVLDIVEKDLQAKAISEKGLVKKLITEKEENLGSGIPASNLTLLHCRHVLIYKSFFGVYRNNRKIRVKGMDSRDQDVDSFLILVAPEDLNKYQLDIISSISISLLEADNIDIFTRAWKKEVYAVLENTLSIAYNEILQLI